MCVYVCVSLRVDVVCLCVCVGAVCVFTRCGGCCRVDRDPGPLSQAFASVPEDGVLGHPAGRAWCVGGAGTHFSGRLLGSLHRHRAWPWGLPTASAEDEWLRLSAATGHSGCHYHRHQRAGIPGGRVFSLRSCFHSLLKKRGGGEKENISWVNQFVVLREPCPYSHPVILFQKQEGVTYTQSTKQPFPSMVAPAPCQTCPHSSASPPHKWTHFLCVPHWRPPALLTWVLPRR